jgi:hypothetical protein
MIPNFSLISFTIYRPALVSRLTPIFLSKSRKCSVTFLPPKDTFWQPSVSEYPSMMGTIWVSPSPESITIPVVFPAPNLLCTINTAQGLPAFRTSPPALPTFRRIFRESVIVGAMVWTPLPSTTPRFPSELLWAGSSCGSKLSPCPPSSRWYRAARDTVADNDRGSRAPWVGNPPGGQGVGMAESGSRCCVEGRGTMWGISEE